MVMIMDKYERTCNLLTMHCQKYPRLQIQDILKYLYQSSFGCEHLVTDLSSAVDYISNESKGVDLNSDNLIDSLDGEYSRVHLSFLNRGLSAETLGKIFLKSAKKEPAGVSELEEKIQVAIKLMQENKLPFSPTEFEAATQEWRNGGFSAVHHSDEFRANYNPAYRVISNTYIPFLPLFARVDKILKEKNAVVAIEGGSASGKTTLSKMFEELYDCTVFHMDDFFLRPEQRTPQRYAQIGGNIDRERFLEEVLMPLKENKSVCYRKFDCSTMTLSTGVKIVPKRLTVIEGVYSMHPAFSGYYDCSAFLDISPQLQKKRIEKRNGPQLAKRFFDEWIPLEEIYFEKLQIKKHSNILISILE